MAGVLRLALGLAFFGVLLTAARFAPGGTSDVDLTGEVTLLAASRGHMLPGAPLEGGDEAFENVLCIGDLILKDMFPTTGLRLAVLDPGLTCRDSFLLDIAGGGTSASDLRRTLDEVPAGGMVLFAVQGSVHREGEQLADFDDVLASLGARVSPFRSRSASWAFLSARLEEGWTPLSEVYSEERGVTLAFLAKRDVESYAGTEGQLYIATAEGRSSLLLYDSYASTSSASPNVARNRYGSAGGFARKSITLPAAQDGAYIRWEDIPLGDDPLMNLSLGSAASGGALGAAEVSLKVQGEVVSVQAIPAGVSKWQPWESDLSSWSNQVVSLEFFVEGEEGGGRVLLGEPVLSWGGKEAKRAPRKRRSVSTSKTGSTSKSDARQDTAPASAPNDGKRPVGIPSPFNGRVLRSSPDAGGYVYLVGGHLYGAPRNQQSIFPSASLLGNIDVINDAGASFFMSLGDFIRYPGPKHFGMFREGFAKRLSMPLFNIVGNHDVASRSNYHREVPGPTRGSMRHGNVLHVILDTEVDPGRISGDQLADVTALLEEAAKDDSLGSIALYGHKLIWLDANDELELVRRKVNNTIGYQDEGAFARDVLPLLRKLARIKQVVFFSGDIGIDVSLPLFYHKESDRDLTWIATGLGDTADDALLRVQAGSDGRLSYEVLRLDRKESEPLESFNLDYWKKHFDE